MTSLSKLTLPHLAMDQASFAEQMLNNPGDIPRYLEAMVRLHMRIHAHAAIQFANLKVKLAANIAATKRLDERRLYEDYQYYTDLEKVRANAMSQAKELEELFARDVEELDDGDGKPVSAEPQDGRISAG